MNISLEYINFTPSPQTRDLINSAISGVARLIPEEANVHGKILQMGAGGALIQIKAQSQDFNYSFIESGFSLSEAIQKLADRAKGLQ